MTTCRLKARQNTVDTGDNVSVIVPTFNRAEFISECLDSLLAQTLPAYEILVIDDGSQDNTPETVRALRNHVRYIRKENGGKASALNLALPLVKGNLVWVFDDDDVALPDAIERRVNTLNEFPEASFVYSPHWLGESGPAGKIVRNRIHATRAYDYDRFLIELLRGCFFHLNSALVRKELYDVTGPFDRGLLRSQDYDMQIRLARFGRGVFCSHPSFIFRQHEGSRGPKRARHSNIERTDVFRTYNQVIGKRVRASLPLGEYLVPRAGDQEVSQNLREALLSRMLVMASMGCIPEMLDDISSALTTLPSDANLNNAEARYIRDAFCTKHAWPAYKDSQSSLLPGLKMLASLPNGKRAYANFSYGLARRMSLDGASGSDVLSTLRLVSLFVFWSIFGARGKHRASPLNKTSRTPDRGENAGK